MKRQSAWEAWKLLVLSLSKGIGAFLLAVIGLAVGVAASAVIIGLPLLAFVLIVCRRMLESEHGMTSAWLGGRAPIGGQPPEDGGTSRGQRGLKRLLSVFADSRSYRGVVYCLLQLPAGAVCFALALAVPLAALAVLLSPAARIIVMDRFGYELFADGWLFESMSLAFGFTPYELSWLAGGFGLLLVLLVPAAVRMLGRFYAAWIDGIAGTEAATVSAGIPAVRERPDKAHAEQANLPEDPGADPSPLKLELERLEHRLAPDAPRS